MGVGSRISIAYTRAMVDAAISKAAWMALPGAPDPVFGIEVPTECPGVPTELLDQRLELGEPGRI